MERIRSHERVAEVSLFPIASTRTLEMSLPEVVPRITRALDAAGISYMLTGSFASAHYGSPRSTQDIDVVIRATPEQLRDLAAELERSGYYVDLDTALEAGRRESLFNVIDLRSGQIPPLKQWIGFPSGTGLDSQPSNICQGASP